MSLEPLPLELAQYERRANNMTTIVSHGPRFHGESAARLIADHMRIYKKAARVLVVGPTKYFANRAYSKLVAEDPDQFQFPLDKMMSIYSSHGGIIQFAETRSCIRGAINKSLFGLSWFYIASSYAKSDPTPDEVKRAFDVVDDRTRYEPRIVVKTNVDGIIIGD
jgi:hypothetical protein